MGRVGEIESMSKNVYFIYDVVRLDEKYLINEFKSRDINLKLVNAENEILQISDLRLEGVGFIRTISQTRALISSYIYETLGCTSINNFKSMIIGGNKLFTLMLLRKYGVPIPETYITFSKEKALELAQKLEKPLIVKPIQGSWGRFVSLINSAEELELLIKHREVMDNPLMKIFMIQEYVRKPDRDLRIIVVNDQVVAGIYRYSTSDWRTNTARGGIAKPLRIDLEIEEISVKASKIVGTDYAGVDLIESKDGYKVLEVNVVPEFKNVMKATGVNVAKHVVDMVIDKLKK